MLGVIYPPRCLRIRCPNSVVSLRVKAKEVNKDPRLKDKDKDQGLEFRDRNQGFSTLPAFIKQRTRNHFRGQVFLGF